MGAIGGIRAGVFGVGGALPGDVVGNAHFASRLDTSDEWIVRRSGIHSRHRLNGSVTLADLAAEACREALDDARRDPAEVDHVIAATITADRLTPGLAPAVVGALDLPRAAAHDVNAACAGFLYALDQAAALVETGRAGVVLVCGAEALSRITDEEDRSTAFLFGDGAGAVVVAAGELDVGCPPLVLGADGRHADLLYAEADERLLRMEGPEVFRHAVPGMARATRMALSRAGVEPGDLDLLVAHQANARIVEAVAADLGVAPERVALNIDRYANTSSASIPLALWEADREGRLRPGALVGLVAFGAGFVWGAGVISWKERVHVCA